MSDVQKSDFTLTTTPEEFQELLNRLPTAEFMRIGLQAVDDECTRKYMISIVLGDEIKIYTTLSDFLDCLSKSLIVLSPDVVPTT